MYFNNNNIKNKRENLLFRDLVRFIKLKQANERAMKKKSGGREGKRKRGVLFIYKVCARL